MARPIRARTAPRNRSRRQRSEQGKPTAGLSHSESALAIRSPSRRLSGERLARLRARDALATAGKMPALLSLAPLQFLPLRILRIRWQSRCFPAIAIPEEFRAPALPGTTVWCPRFAPVLWTQTRGALGPKMPTGEDARRSIPSYGMTALLVWGRGVFRAEFSGFGGMPLAWTMAQCHS